MTPPLARPEGAGPPVTTSLTNDAPFDVREFARTARGSHRGDAALAVASGASLPVDAVQLLRVLRDLEHTTLNRMRNLLVTATHKDARMTAFLTTWAFEKFWIADALDAVLEAAGEKLSGPAVDGRRRRSLRERAERRGPVLRAILANFDGPQIVAAHVTTGLVDEQIAQAAYRRLSSLADALRPVAKLVTDVKDRHIRFLTEEAPRRLAASARAQRLTRSAIRKAVWPIGAVELPAAERSFFEATVFGDETGHREATTIAQIVARLPGLAPVSQTLATRLAP